MATHRTGAFPLASVKLMTSIALWAISAHSTSLSKRSSAALVSDSCHTTPGTLFLSGSRSSPPSGVWPARTFTRLLVPVGTWWIALGASIVSQTSRTWAAVSCCPSGTSSNDRVPCDDVRVFVLVVFPGSE